MFGIIAVVIIVLVISFIMAFIISNKEFSNSKTSLADDPSVLFDDSKNNDFISNQTINNNFSDSNSLKTDINNSSTFEDEDNLFDDEII